jgi:alpha-tubulin N-acetyltransferase 1
MIYSGKGSLIGLLKVGKKRLFIYDTHNINHELQPLCLLDFFIHTTQQRKGLGLKLFDFMLKVNLTKYCKIVENKRFYFVI